MKIRLMAVLLVLAACRVSSTAREDEAKKWAAALATQLEVYNLNRACEPERAVYTKASSAYTEALTSRSSRAAGTMELDLGKAQLVLATCIKEQGDYIPTADDDRYARAGIPNSATSGARSKRLHDVQEAWLDACFLCTSPQVCITRYREVMRLQQDEVAEYTRSPVKSRSLCKTDSR
jgi:hypothetical protein